jgi:hypothetical protein
MKTKNFPKKGKVLIMLFIMLFGFLFVAKVKADEIKYINITMKNGIVDQYEINSLLGQNLFERKGETAYITVTYKDETKVYSSNDILSIKTSSVKLITAAKQLSNANDKLGMYPNPTNGELNISCDLKQSGNIFIKLYSINGSMVFGFQLANQSAGRLNHAIDLTNLPTGTYICVLKTDTEFLGTNKIIKK